MPAPAAAAWLVARAGAQQFGPYAIADLIAYVAERRVLPSDSLWHQGAPAWVEVAQLPALTPGQPAAAPAPAPAPQPAPAAAETVAAPAAQAFAPAQAMPAVAPQPIAPAPAAGQRIGLHIRRALGWNLRSMPVEPDERALLIAHSVDEDNAQRYLVWRRSVLLVVTLPTLLSALLATIGWLSSNRSSLSALGNGLELARLAALYALPVSAFFAARTWDRHRRSRNLLLRGWLVAFLMPLILAIFPFSWRLDMSGGDEALVSQVSSALGLLGAISVYVTLMPSVLSLIPGVLRGCLRIKALLPESILPGLFLIAAAPLYVLLFLVIFTTVNQLVGNLVLMLAVLALLVAPLLYLLNARTFTRPLHTPEEVAKIGNIQALVTLVVGIGLALLVVFAFTATIMGRSLIGVDSETSLMRPWSPALIQFPLEYFVRSLFTTVVVADLFMQMNLSLWRHSKSFAASPEADAYDRLMSEIEEARDLG